jgi:hypothetical protein
MRTVLAVNSADRISRCAMVLAGLLCGVLVFFVAVPLALSSPFPPTRETEWVVHRPHVAAPVTFSEPIDEEQAREIEMAVSWSFVSLVPSGAASSFEPAEFAPAESAAPEQTDSTTVTTASIPATSPAPAPSRPAASPPKRTASLIDEANEYLWEVYTRAPTKRDSSGDFTWKDPAAAKRFGLSMPEYVISGMDPDFREQLYHAGKAMDAAGIRWSILSAFRDDYRQSIASGLKAGSSNSLHGGKARTGGYGHGQAVDVTSEDGNASAVWRWIDAHGGKFGLYRPMPGADPSHVQPKSTWHKLASSLRESRARLLQEARAVATDANSTR